MFAPWKTLQSAVAQEQRFARFGAAPASRGALLFGSDAAASSQLSIRPAASLG